MTRYPCCEHCADDEPQRVGHAIPCDYEWCPGAQPAADGGVL